MIDLRSDTVTKPTPAMREAMARAPVGDDVFGEDPTVNEFEARVAELLGKPAGLFVSSGTMGNQIAVRLACTGGDELLCDDQCHVYHYEQGAYAQFFGVAARPLPTRWGLPMVDELLGLVRGNDIHHPRTRLLTLENTHNRRGGIVLDYHQLSAICDKGRELGLTLHLDGARLWNAIVATGYSAREWGQHFDTVTVCFSKGLGAPVGSVLCGSHDAIRQARRIRKALGGGTRQAGILAAAAIFALDHHVARLQDDHDNAARLGAIAAESPNVTIYPDAADAPQTTNIVYLDVAPAWGTAHQLAAKLRERGVLAFDIAPQRIRFVTHLNVTREDVEQAGTVLREICG